MTHAISAAIANGQTKTDAIPIPENEQIVAVSILTDSFTGATFSFEITFDGGTTWLPVRAVGGASVYAPTASATKAFIPIDPMVFFAAAVGYTCSVRVVSASSETGAKSLLIHTKKTE